MKEQLAELIKKYSKWITTLGQLFFLLAIPLGIWNSIVTGAYEEIINSIFVGIAGAFLWKWVIKRWIGMM